MLKGQYLYSEGKSEAELTIGAANETGICSEEAVFLDIKNLIRSVQRAEGNPDCFGRGQASCDQTECAWRPYCLKS